MTRFIDAELSADMEALLRLVSTSAQRQEQRADQSPPAAGRIVIQPANDAERRAIQTDLLNNFQRS